MIKNKLVRLTTILTIALILALLMGISALATNESLEETPTIYVEDGLVQAGDSVVVGVHIKNNPGVLNALLTLSFDERITLLKIEQGTALSTLDFTPPGKGSGTTYSSPCNFLWDALDESDTSNGAILLLTFEIPADAEPGTVYTLSLSYISGDISDGNLNPVEFELINGSIEVLDYTPGDVNDDGRINGNDVTLIRRYIAGGYDATIIHNAADVNNDGRINGNDITLIRRYIAGGYGVELKPSTFCFEHKAEKIDGVEATCTFAGLTEGSKCSKCGEIIVAQEVVPMKDHTEVIDEAIAPTCTATGFTEGKHCSVCNTVLVEQIVVDATGHTQTTTTTVNATCLETGSITVTCDVCGEVLSTQIIDALGHDEISHESKAPTCTEIGWDEYVTCSRCDYTTYSEKEALGHTEVVDSAVAPNCTTTGLTEGKHCSVCDEILIAQTVVDALGHTNGDVVVENSVAPDCVNNGSCDNVVYCSVCNSELSRETVTVDALGHTEVVDEAIAPTCTTTGLTEGTHCSVCDEVLVAQTIINMIEHNFVGENCQRCGINFELYEAKREVSLLKQKCQEIESELISSYNLISDHESRCNGVCQIEGVYDSFERACQELGGFKHYTETIDGIIVELEQAEHLDIQTLNALKPYIEELKAFSESGQIEEILDTLRAEVEALDKQCILSIVIPEGVTSIDSYEFAGYSGLVSITIPDSVTTIGDYAFEDCSSLVNIIIPNSVTTIGDYAFEDCSSLVNIIIPNSVTTIGNRVFSRCSSLTSIDVGNNNEYYTSIDGNLYSKDGKTLIQYAIGKQDASFIIPNSVMTIGDGAFEFCRLTSITIPDSVTSIGNSVFAMSPLTSITIPDSVTNLGDNAFYWCSYLVSVVIGDSVTSIGSNTFYGCMSLTNVTIGNSVTSIGYSAFARCHSITSVTIPCSVTSIEGGAFSDCTSLVNIYFEGTITQWNAIDKDNGYFLWNSNSGNYIVYCNDGEITKDGVVTSYPPYSQGLEYTLNADGESYSVTGIGTCTDTDIIIPSKYKGKLVKNIGGYAFNGCDSITSVTIPSSVKNMNSYAFTSCINLTTIHIEQGSDLNYVGDYALADCSSLREVYFDDLARYFTDIIFGTNYDGGSGDYVIYFTDGKIIKGGNFECYTHQYDEGYIYISPTCTTQGIYMQTCWYCGKTQQKPISATGHTNGAVVVENNVAPDCLNSGSYDNVIYCTVCKVELSRETTTVDALGHTEVVDLAVDPTCTETGLTEGKHCSVCNEILVEQTVIDALGHTEVVDSAVAPTCTITGLTEGKHCSVCNEILVEQTVVDALGHTEVIDEEIHASSCNFMNYTAGSHCSVCETVLIERQPVGVGPHAEGSWYLDEWQDTSYTIYVDKICDWCQQWIESKEYRSEGLQIYSLTFEDEYGNWNGDRYCIIGIGDCTDTFIVIPKYEYYYDDYYYGNEGYNLIEGIGPYAFENCTDIRTIVIPSSVSKIDSSAFDGCTSLEHIGVHYQNDYYKSIDGNLYSKDGKTLIRYAPGKQDTYFYVPDSVTTIAAGAFDGCIYLEHIEIGDNVITIEDNFKNWTNLAIIDVSDENTTYKSVDGNLYSKDGKTLIRYAPGRYNYSFTVPDFVTYVENYAFAGSNLTEVDFGSGVMEIGYDVFENCTTIERLTLSTAMTSIDSYEFYGLTSLTYVYIPDSVTIINSCAFSECTSLKSINLPYSLTSIGENAFYGCSSLTSINLPDSLTSIGENAFAGTSIVYNEYGNGYYMGNEENPYLVFVEPINENITNCQIHDDTTMISEAAFANHKSLVSVKIGNKIESITYEMFRGCSALTEVVFGSAVTTISDYAFYCCSSLKNIVIPNSVTNIGYYTFAYCQNLEMIIIGDSVKNINSGVFYECTSLKTVIMGESVADIDYRAFYGCTSLQEIEFDENNPHFKAIDGNIYSKDGKTLVRYLRDNEEALGFEIPEGVETIGDGAFEFCQNLQTIRIPSSVKTIGDGAFEYCTSLYEVTLEEGIETIGYRAFVGCQNLQTIRIPGSVKTICESAFEDCISLYEVTFEEGIKTIRDRAFAGCASLRSLILPKSLNSISDYLFDNSGIQSLYIPDSVTYIGNNAFYNCSSLEIYCEYYEKPHYWSYNWNYVTIYDEYGCYYGEKELLVYWGYDVWDSYDEWGNPDDMYFPEDYYS